MEKIVTRLLKPLLTTIFKENNNETKLNKARDRKKGLFNAITDRIQ